MEQGISPPPLSLYIHIPFCLSKCGYCSFFSVPFSIVELQNYLKHLHKELDLYQDLLQKPLHTLYFGGGTPSLLTPLQLAEICQSVNLSPQAEVTLEINPIQLTPEFLQGLSKTRINRLSLGVQSMNNDDLLWLNRRHKAEQIPQKIKLCRDYGYNNISLDLMYGLPKSDLPGLQRNIQAYLNLQPEHISCYLLALDEDCSLYKDMALLPDDDTQAEQYDTICNSLKEAGYAQYEISNFALVGKESQHNLTYWHSKNYLAIGASAAGWISPCRYHNPSGLAEYYACVWQGERFPDATIQNKQRIWEDYLMMGLRLLEGININSFQKLFEVNLPDFYGAKIKRLMHLGLLEQKEERLRLTQQALFISNAVIAELIL
ncbi:MAG: radical SAM family heme chaperone HemW [Candidatus Cloacimonetes bacterium]|nr:radical SAM family heme chaperone HemW [Candidatus Cloacimonadota bacterium]